MKYKFADYGCSERFKKHEIQTITIKGTPRYMHPLMKASLGDGCCKADPFKCDEYSLEVTMKEVMDRLNTCSIIWSREKIESNFETERVFSIYRGLDPTQKAKIADTLMQNYLFTDLIIKLQGELNDPRQKLDKERKLYIYNTLGQALEMNGEYDSALEYLNKAQILLENLQYVKEMASEEELANVYIKIGKPYQSKGDFD